jgi:hypothetical protein
MLPERSTIHWASTVDIVLLSSKSLVLANTEMVCADAVVAVKARRKVNKVAARSSVRMGAVVRFMKRKRKMNPYANSAPARESRLRPDG